MHLSFEVLIFGSAYLFIFFRAGGGGGGLLLEFYVIYIAPSSINCP